MKKIIYAIVPARSGSKGIIDKNIKILGGKELLAHSIEFAKKLNIDRIICSTDSEKYANIARKYGAEVPCLRSASASSDSAMEHDILSDLYDMFDKYFMCYPDLFVWLRPTFIFRDITAVNKCINMLLDNNELSSCRVITESESRLYFLKKGKLLPAFNDNGKSMIRRQNVRKLYRVYNTDVFRGNPKNCSDNFLGKEIGYVIANKICGFDIDDEIDLSIVSTLFSNKELIDEYL
jgi:CMP-N-acetylneuraminic acid synthetase